MTSEPAALLATLATLSTTSLIDAAPALRVLPHEIRPIVPGRRFAGRVVTARADRDLRPVIAALRTTEAGDVLVVDASDGERAVAGELFASEAQRRGLAALVVSGRTRDTATVAKLAIPVWSSGFAPNAYAATAEPVANPVLDMGGVRVAPGDLIVGDDDGLVVGTAQEFEAALPRAREIEYRESALQQTILGGSSLFDHFS